jgi:outer membrane protein insertion porin family
VREQYDDNRLGDTITFGKRFNYEFSGAVSLRGERVKIDNIENPFKDRAPEILESEGKSTITSVALTLRHDTTNPGLFPDRGHTITGRSEYYGALGGDYTFHKVNIGFDAYQSVHEDLLDRKTVLSFHTNAGFIPSGESVYFERFYAGGIGSIRGFKFRGVSPRSGREDDAVGGDFSLTGSVELNFPVAGDQLRAVVFVDAGDVEPSVRFGTIRTSVGAGVRVLLPFFGQTPLAIDFAVPITKDDTDEKQLISFSFGFIQ